MQNVKTFEQLRNKSHDQLIQEFDDLLDKVGSSGGLDKPHFLLRAQLLLGELARRDQEKQTHRMLSYTKWITRMTLCMLVFTGVITFMTYMIWKAS